jgi:hypothetical protein
MPVSSLFEFGIKRRQQDYAEQIKYQLKPFTGMVGPMRAATYATWNNPGLGITLVIPSLE